MRIWKPLLNKNPSGMQFSSKCPCTRRNIFVGPARPERICQLWPDCVHAMMSAQETMCMSPCIQCKCCRNNLNEENLLGSSCASCTIHKLVLLLMYSSATSLAEYEPAEALPSGMSCVFITSVRIRRRATSSIAFLGAAIAQCSEVTRTMFDVTLAEKVSTEAFGNTQEHFTYSWKG